MAFSVRYWGVRGSLPSFPSAADLYQNTEDILNGFWDSGYQQRSQVKEYLDSLPSAKISGYGGNTTCVELETPKDRIIIDCGSGIRALGEKLMRGPCGAGRGVVHILITHFHWDHLIGLPFFIPILAPKNQINFYAVQPDLEKIIRSMFLKPYFPVSFETLPSQIKFHRLEPRKNFKINDINITPYQLDHPDPCWGYRVEYDGKSYAHCVDTECTRMSRKDMGLDLPLYENADLMYFDAQYSLKETVDKASWGHSAASVGLDIAIRENIKSVIFAHHDPGAFYGQISQLEKQTTKYYHWLTEEAHKSGKKVPNVNWEFAYEGMERIL